jgi:hypothetical protein
MKSLIPFLVLASTLRSSVIRARLALSVVLWSSMAALGVADAQLLRDADLTAPTEASAAANGGRSKDFSVTIRGATGEASKFLTYGWLGFAGGTVHWQYNDAGRSAAIAATQADAINAIQTGMALWSAACNVKFVFDGVTTTRTPSLEPPNASFDGFNVVGWRPLPGTQTGVTVVTASGPGPGGPFTLTEADIALNNLYDPVFAQTILHEVGHMIGIDHSDINNVVMSGPPTSVYGNQGVLQPDDINACISLYGPPVPTARTISGTVSNGASPLANVTFCARPAIGVTCTASSGTGAYSCTVPNGWSGLLHAPGPTGLRIKPQSFTNVSANLSGQNPVVQAIGACNLDVDNNGLIEPATDGAAILRRMLGISSTGFSGLSGTCAANTTSATLFNATAGNYNATGGLLTRPGTDGLVILRAMQGLTGTAVTNGLGLAAEAGATNTTWTAIRNNFLNTTCGADFLP